ncbi:MAG: c-type cytochrome [Planctomycetes bacterium]|nr:c-type cytochrome [Planctomycetota bacterium]
MEMSDLVAASLVVVSLAGCPADSATGRSLRHAPSDPATLARGQEVYSSQCALCHGAEGRGDGEFAFLLDPRPRDLTAARFRIASTANRVPTDADLFDTITRGMPGSAMPPWGHLPEADRWALVAHVRRAGRMALEAQAAGRGKDAAAAAAWALGRTTPGEVLEAPAPPAERPEDLARGRLVYLERCAACHGPGGRGDGAQVQVTDEGDPIRPRDFTAGAFKGGNDPAQVWRSIRGGLRGTPMPATTDLSGDDTWRLVRYVLSLVPPGAAALAAQGPFTIHARRVEALPPDAEVTFDEAWAAQPATWIPLMALAQRAGRAPGVLVQAIHDANRVAVRLTWEDATSDASEARQEAFTDGAAVQLSAEAAPPLFAMGGPRGSVEIWHWKASRQADKDAGRFHDVDAAWPALTVDRYDMQRNLPPGARVDYATAGAERHDPVYQTGWGAGNPLSGPEAPRPCLDYLASGPGTLRGQPAEAQNIAGAGHWGGGAWHVAYLRPLVGDAHDVALRPGQAVSVAFAVWDGAARDRDGQKAVTTWHRLMVD